VFLALVLGGDKMLGDYRYNLIRKDVYGTEFILQSNNFEEVTDFVIEYRSNPRKNQACTLLLMEATDVIDSIVDKIGRFAVVKSLEFDNEDEEE
jgi:hypothetical protein